MIGLLLLQPIAAMAAGTQDHALIREVVAAFIQQQTADMRGKVSYEVGEIDRRISLPECSKLEALLPDGGKLVGKTAVRVRCNDAQGWSISVRVQIRVSADLLISARALPMGYTLREEDLSTQTTETTQSGGMTDAKQAVGKVLRHGISAGQVLREDMLRPPYSIVQGQAVQLIVRGNKFSIRNEGVALTNASEGQAIQVRTSSGRTLGGIAGASGVVEVKP
ncbi:MAG: flagellar basal body P-ring formation protein FlgA [Nitrosomonadales bacterium]|nr:flagellar basal body P-ring formation protein FlgA [Nitrosomonadales bacterium]